MKNLVLVCIVFLLAGCQAKMQAIINVSELKSPQIEKKALLEIEISSCHDFDDSRKASNTLLDTIDKIKNAIPGAKYVECYKKRFDSIAEFRIPMIVGKEAKGDSITLKSDGEELLKITLTEKTASKIRMLIEEDDNIDDFQFLVFLENDTKKKIKVRAISVFANGEPSIDLIKTIPVGMGMTFVLSDVSTKLLINGEQVPVLRIK